MFFDMMPFDNLHDIPGAENAYLVGGCVRDRLIGLRPQDFDIAAPPPVRDFAEHIARRIGGHCVELGKPGRQVIRIVSGRPQVDVAPINGPSIESDLAKRDFTINALARRLSSGEIIDCTGGIRDLEQKIIRMVSDQSFIADPLRLLRTYRLAAILNFRIDTATSAAVARHADKIRNVAGERIRLELFKLLEVENACLRLEQMSRERLLFAVIPELEPLVGCLQNRHHAFDAWIHTLKVVEEMEAILNRPPRLLSAADSPALSACLKGGIPVLLKISALLHDIGKPATRKIIHTKGPVFYGHHETGAEMAEAVSARLRFSVHETRIVTQIIRHHLGPLRLWIQAEKGALSRKAVTRFFMRCETLTPLILLHALADHRGKRPRGTLPEDDFSRFILNLLTAYFTEYQERKNRRPLLTGHDLISEFDLKPGPDFKFILNRVEAARLSGEAVTRENGLEIVSELLKTCIGDRQPGIDTPSGRTKTGLPHKKRGGDRPG
ncbi:MULTISPECIES: CCA tRNA nucleotidyltransferase [Desulfococcus]|uniref:Metal dependent phosphohydrolase n=1 Tax=Desulfococcus multivorans DSM 2059 TaxID=1121405 RepID=S7TWH2_DESML|nr:HD domain-containing protein [Desulfococcus multivorans]AOY58029.1 Cca: predicted CCA-adding enzyme (tRNA nucleotidyltransferase) [Desulfococcus multivorans]EPR41401.1 metal dependent phosphohydrolase [Desulfococcus multivorans DSM 2059]SJZ70675.1 poly(A) polymerase [Desulfococcus multivorans DSM 2059]